MSRYEGPRTPLGERIQAAREAKGMSQEKLAQALQTSRQLVIRWEKGEHVPQRRSAEKLAQVLDQPVDTFRRDEPPKDEELLRIVAERNDAAARRLIA